MNFNNAKKEVLEYLFEGYLANGGTHRFYIQHITEKYGIDSDKLGEMLVQDGLVKNQNYGLPGGFMGQITMAGIANVKPQHLLDNLSTVLSVLGESGNQLTGLMDILILETKDYQIAHDFGHYLYSRGIIEEPIFVHDVYVKLNLRGMQMFEEIKPRFMQL